MKAIIVAIAGEQFRATVARVDHDWQAAEIIETLGVLGATGAADRRPDCSGSRLPVAGSHGVADTIRT